MSIKIFDYECTGCGLVVELPLTSEELSKGEPTCPTSQCNSLLKRQIPGPRGYVKFTTTPCKQR